MVALAKEKGLYFTVQQLFLYPTIAELAQVAETAVDFLVGKEGEEKKLAELLTELEGVSEEEATARLREKFQLGQGREAR